MKHFHSTSKSDQEEILPILHYLIEHGNTTVYQWRTKGQVPISIERPSLNYKFAEAVEINETEPDVILGLDDDDDLTTTTQGIEVTQTAEQTDVIDFDTVDNLSTIVDVHLNGFVQCRKEKSIGQRLILFPNCSIRP
jgi:hypothetical protein